MKGAINMDFLVFDFLNSQCFNEKNNMDDTTRKEKINDFLNYYHITLFDINSEQLSELYVLYNWIIELLEKITLHGILTKEEINKINLILQKEKAIRQLIKKGNDYIIETKTKGYGLEHFIHEIVTSFAVTIAEYDQDRIRICENPQCKWVFYDKSKSKTKRHCDSRCANLMKVRRYRKKQLKD